MLQRIACSNSKWVVPKNVGAVCKGVDNWSYCFDHPSPSGPSFPCVYWSREVGVACVVDEVGAGEGGRREGCPRKKCDGGVILFAY